MALEWKTSKVETPHGKFTVTHWAKHDPQDILNVLESTPLEHRQFSNALPPLSVHSFGRQELVARHFKPNGFHDLSRLRYLPAGEVFSTLQQLVKKKIAISEMPVAFVERPGKDQVVVTLWKKSRRTLFSALHDETLSFKRKLELAKKAAAQLGKLNQAGFEHVHPVARNFVVLENNEVRLIDPTLLRPFSTALEGRVLANNLHKTIKRSIRISKKPVPKPQLLKIYAAVVPAYLKAFSAGKPTISAKTRAVSVISRRLWRKARGIPK